VTLRRPKGFSPIDSLAIPLPHGTEVTARVERALGDKRIPKGVVGRVVKVREDGVDVQVVGFGVVYYQRDEVPLDEVLEEAEALVPSLESAREASALPKRPDVLKAEAPARTARAGFLGDLHVGAGKSPAPCHSRRNLVAPGTIILFEPSQSRTP